MKSLLLALSCVALLVSSPATVWAADDWSDNYAKAVAQAKAEGKPLLLDFTGSDWCPPCKMLHSEVFEAPKFKRWAKKNVVLVMLDFPRGKKLSEETVAQNKELASKYKITGYPTVIVTDAAGQEHGRRVGLARDFSADTVIDELEGFVKKAGKPAEGGASATKDGKDWPFKKPQP